MNVPSSLPTVRNNALSPRLRTKTRLWFKKRVQLHNIGHSLNETKKKIIILKKFAI